MSRKKTIRKRYIFLIILAIVPFYRFYHEEDYCFGDADLLIIGMLSVVFFIAFLVIFFINLYKISLRIELFNYRPVLILTVFSMALYFALKFHNKNVFKTEKQHFSSISDAKDLHLFLFTDKTFEIKKKFTNYSCYYKGNFSYKGDTLFLNPKNALDIDSVYWHDKRKKTLISLKTATPIFSIAVN